MSYGRSDMVWGDMDPDPSYGNSCIDVEYDGYSPREIDNSCHSNPVLEFDSEEEMVSSKIFQKHLRMALSHKDRQIRQLQEEILKLSCNIFNNDVSQ